MNPLFKSAGIFLCALTLGAFAIKAVRAQQAGAPAASLMPDCAFVRAAECLSSDDSRKSAPFLSPADDVATSKAESAEPLQLYGNAARLRLDLHQATITNVLSALHAAFHIDYQTSVALNEPVNGTYAGSLEHVIARVLAGYSYNYVIKRDNAKFNLIIYGKAGERAIADPGLIPLRERGAAAYQAKQ
jgi:hypothetical protein